MREDEERVFFSVVIPGFSIWAILGNVDAPVVKFLVDDLTITPAESLQGEAVTIQVQVTNLTAEAAEFNGALWLNSRVDTTRRVALGPNETAPLSFTVQPKAGTYEVRIDRLLGSFVVQAALAPAPAVPVSTPVPPAIPVPAAAPVVEERGVGLIVGIIVGGLAAIAIVAIIVAVFISPNPPKEGVGLAS